MHLPHNNTAPGGFLAVATVGKTRNNGERTTISPAASRGSMQMGGVSYWTSRNSLAAIQLVLSGCRCGNDPQQHGSVDV